MDRRKFLKSGVALVATAALGKLAATELTADSLPEQKQNENNKSDKVMNIVIITGSPRQKGNTNHLADRFTAGAEEAGHSVYRFDSAHANVHGCIACNHCRMNGDCVLNDDFTSLLPKLLEADMVVFCSPMYYFGFSSQLKAVIDRFYSRTYKLTGGKKTALLMAYANNAERDEKPMIEHYKRLADYMEWEDVGMVIAPGMWPAGSVNGTKYADEAYQLGKNL